MALALTDWENHRTDVEYENALVFKLFVVQFLNSYATLYYVAFFKAFFEGCENDRCVEDLYYRLVGVLVSRVAYKALSLAVIPRVKVILRLARALMRKKNMDVDAKDDRVADHQQFLNEYNSVIASTVTTPRKKADFSKASSGEVGRRARQTDRVLLVSAVGFEPSSFLRADLGGLRRAGDRLRVHDFVRGRRAGRPAPHDPAHALTQVVRFASR
jgi:hypothetical protein